MKRRQLLQSLLITGLPIAPAKAVEKVPGIDQNKYDVIVIGTGAAGLAAAVSAAEHGAKRVLVLEKEATIGGHTILSTGYVTAVDKSEFLRGDFEKACEAMLKNVRSTNEGTGNAELQRKLVRDSGSVIPWLAGMGLQWERRKFQTLGGLEPRSYVSSVVRAGFDYITTLNKRSLSLGVKIQFSSRAMTLLTNGDGSISGVLAKRDDSLVSYYAPVVILATGGYSGNVAMRSRYVPWLTAKYSTTADPYFRESDSSTGDGIDMGQRIGADVVDMDCIMTIPFWGGRLTDYVGADIYVDRAGKRFVTEDASWLHISNAIRKLPDEEFWVITDSQSTQGASRSSKIMSGTVKIAGTIDEMARGMSVDKKVLRETISRYNSFVRSGKDLDFGKTFFTQEINKPPFFYGKEHLYVHYCCGGLKIDAKARVISVRGEPIPGLYAAGETTGGVHGKDRLGGCSMTDCFVYGHEAGKSGVEYIASGGQAEIGLNDDICKF